MRRTRGNRRKGSARAIAAVVVVLAFFLHLPLLAADYDEQRARTGVRLFRSLLAADLGLDQKVRPDGTILVLFFGSDGARVRELVELFNGDAEGQSGLQGHPVTVETTLDPTFAQYQDPPPAGVFLTTDPGGDGLQKIVRFGIDHGVVVYSPFEGHVERGVLAGLSIEAQVRPYLNSATLEASDISLKSFFLKVTKLYP
jgi:hypothetical protein